MGFILGSIIPFAISSAFLLREDGNLIGFAFWAACGAVTLWVGVREIRGNGV
jgi:hypothetical protein